jgi:hypothetical protein
MAAELAASERLNYLSKKQRAVSSRHSRQIINAQNGVNFNLGQTTVIQIAGGQAATYWDFQNSYLKFTVQNQTTNSDTNGAQKRDIYVQSAYDLIQRVEILADGQTLSNIEEYGALVRQYQRLEVPGTYASQVGQVLAGTQSLVSDGTVQDEQKLHGAATDPNAGAKRTFCIPLVLTPLFNVNKYIPLVGRSNLQIRITWQNVEKAVTGGATVSSSWVHSVATDSTIALQNCGMVCSMVRLSGEANAMVLQNTGGIFELVTSDFRLARGTINTVSEKSLSVNCGFAFSSLDRISFSFYSARSGKLMHPNSLGCQYYGDLTNYALSINGEEYPRKRVDVEGHTSDEIVGNPAESLAESIIAHRALGDFTHGSQLNSHWAYGAVDADKDSVKGSTVYNLDTEAMQPHSGETLYSGISTIGATTHLLADVADTITNKNSEDADGANLTTDLGIQYTVLIFANFTTALTLDMEGTQTWIVSV